MTELETLSALLPHRPPMLLLNELLHVDTHSSSARVVINEEASFWVSGKGVPSWVGLEYMGQTAALIAGHQLQQGIVDPHLGFLLGTRHFKVQTDYFTLGDELLIRCQEKALVGNSLATFDCLIERNSHCIAEASLSVFRKDLPSEEQSDVE